MRGGDIYMGAAWQRYTELQHAKDEEKRQQDQAARSKLRDEAAQNLSQEERNRFDRVAAEREEAQKMDVTTQQYRRLQADRHFFQKGQLNEGKGRVRPGSGKRLARRLRDTSPNL